VSNSNAIVVIVHDPALLRSLAFALGAHGHAVDAFGSWRSARDRARGASCVILDGCLSQQDRDDCMECVPTATPVIFLAEQDTPMPARTNMLTLHKPLAGADVLSALASFRYGPK
jgi:DNA-binding NtrC family response regulator